MGRRKIKMEMVQDMNTRQVTFSKRRTGLFKKASELATLCNAEIGILVYSPGGKPYSYGKPNLDAVTERFMKECNDDSDTGDEEEEEQEEEEGRGKSRPKMKRINERLDGLKREIEAEKKRGEKSQAKLESAGEERFEKKRIEELTIDELREYMEKLQGIHGRIECQASKMQASSCLVHISGNKAFVE
ncbi:Agamous-like MADS-box protein AGL29 [Hirschfeldia incana]|nr:Agamous-like MADS-box protein AGL29 [Hirschfeldia incana]